MAQVIGSDFGDVLAKGQQLIWSIVGLFKITSSAYEVVTTSITETTDTKVIDATTSITESTGTKIISTEKISITNSAGDELIDLISQLAQSVIDADTTATTAIKSKIDTFKTI